MANRANDLTESDWLQIEMAASGCIGGTSDEWPNLRAAIAKITGRPFGPRKSAAWLQGFCEGVMIQKLTKLKPDYRNHGKYQFVMGWTGSGAEMCVHLTFDEVADRLQKKHGEGRLIDDGTDLIWTHWVVRRGESE